MTNYHSKLSFLSKNKPNSSSKKSRKNFLAYNYYLAFFIAIPFTLVGTLNWLIDPQDIFKTPNYWGINHEKINKDNNDRLYKAVDIINLKPKIIIMGSSRTKQGINPEFAVFQSEKNVYNLALNGPNFYEVKRYIEHAIYNQPDLKQIVLGIDFFMFNQGLDNQPTFKESRLETKHLTLSDQAQNLFSLDVLATSWETMQASQNSPNTVNDLWGDNGFMPNRNYNNGETIWRFHQSIKLFFSLHGTYQLSDAYWQDFEDIVKLCREHNIDLQVFISPAHATNWESIYVMNRWQVFEQWKRDLVKLVPVWDFSGYNSVTTEPIAKNMENYVDNSHYTPEIGNYILQRIFNYQTATVPSDFGALIDSQNIEAHLANIRSDRERWQQNNSEEVNLVEKFYQESLPTKESAN